MATPYWFFLVLVCCSNLAQLGAKATQTFLPPSTTVESNEGAAFMSTLSSTTTTAIQSPAAAAESAAAAETQDILGLPVGSTGMLAVSGTICLVLAMIVTLLLGFCFCKARDFTSARSAKLSPAKAGAGPLASAITANMNLSENFVILHQNIEVKEQIKHGSFGLVSRGIIKQNSAEVVIRPTPYAIYEEAEVFEQMLNEVKVLRDLRHPNIVGVYGILMGKAEISIVLQWCDGEPFDSYVSDRLIPGLPAKERNGSPAYARTILYEVACSMEYLHSLNPPLLQKSLRPHMILVLPVNAPSPAAQATFFAPPRVKLIAESKSLYKRESPVQKGPSLSMTPASDVFDTYLAPEVRSGSPHTWSADVYAFGCIALFSLTAKKPPDGVAALKTAMAIEALAPLASSSGVRSPGSLEYVASKCLTQQPHFRPSFLKISEWLEHFNRPPQGLTPRNGEEVERQAPCKMPIEKSKSQDAGILPRYLPKQIGGSIRLLPEGANGWRVVDKNGIAYRLSKDINDRDHRRRGPEFYALLQGVDEGDWVRVDLDAVSGEACAVPAPTNSLARSAGDVAPAADAAESLSKAHKDSFDLDKALDASDKVQGDDETSRGDETTRTGCSSEIRYNDIRHGRGDSSRDTDSVEDDIKSDLPDDDGELPDCSQVVHADFMSDWSRDGDKGDGLQAAADCMPLRSHREDQFHSPDEWFRTERHNAVV